MSNRRITVSTYETIIMQLKKGLPIREIERTKIAGRRTIMKVRDLAFKNDWLEENALCPSESEIRKYFEKEVRDQLKLKENGHLEKVKTWTLEGHQAKTIHQRLKDNFGYNGSYDSVQRYAKKVKAENQAPNLTTPLYFGPGEAAQVDFGHGPKIYDTRTKKVEQTYFFVMTLCFSRHQFAILVTHQDLETWLFCHQKAFLFFNGIPFKVIIDNPKCAVIVAGYYEAELNKSYESFAKEWGFQIAPCPPRDPQKKGRVESGVNYVKRSFMPLRTFKDLNDANEQLMNWIINDAGQRIHGSTYKKPLEFFKESETLQPIPKSIPEISIWKQVAGARNCHVVYKKCHYSFPYKYALKSLWIKQTPSTIRIYSDGEMIALHPRLFIKGAYSTDENHRPPKALEYFKRTHEWCKDEAKKIGKNTIFVVETFLNNPTQDLLRAAQGVIKLGGKFGSTRLEKACNRAISFKSITYKAIKNILEKGLENKQDDFPNTSQSLPDVYQGNGTYQRLAFNIYQISSTKH